ncbi:hypothetical protein VNI00_011856 [Paramarasmius palmivorus]|uniref:Uncharacterized protein n=1 Tax=Paramarasmius palmivorus TaxID=297713 RepID=A0AAW0C7G6_9AGAR
MDQANMNPEMFMQGLCAWLQNHPQMISSSFPNTNAFPNISQPVPTQPAPTQLPPTQLPPTQAAPTQLPSTQLPSTQLPPNQLPPQPPPQPPPTQLPMTQSEPLNPLSFMSQLQANAPMSQTPQLPPPPLAGNLPVAQALPPAQPSVPPAQAIARPIQAPYTSINMLSSVASSSGTAFPSLSLIQRANADRMDSAERHSRQNKKKRGKAFVLPSLASDVRPPQIEDCMAIAEGDIRVANVEVWIHPAQPTNAERRRLHLPKNMYRYHRNEETYKMVLNSLNLLHQFPNLPITTRLVELVQHLSCLLNSKGYIFPPVAEISRGFALHEGLPLQLLSYTNLGRPNGSNKTPRIASASYRSETTIADLLANPREFAVAKWSISDKNYFIIHLCIRSTVTEALVNLKEVYLGNDDSTRIHRCIHKRVYGMFQSDVDARVYEGCSIFDEDLMEADCDPADGEEEVREERIVAQLLRPSGTMSNSSAARNSSPISSASSRRSTTSQISSASSGRTPSSRISSASSTRTSSSRVSSFSSGVSWMDENIDISSESCSELWQFPEISEQTDDYLGIILNRSDILDAVEVVYELETDGPMHSFSVTGYDLDGLTASWKRKILECIEKQDFSVMYNPTRHFIQTEANLDGPDYEVTSGPGIEREVVHTLAKEYLETRRSEFFALRYGGFCTLATIPAQSALLMSDTKKRDLQLLGAIVGLCLLYGYPVDPINPLLLIYLLYDNNPASLTKSLVSTWFPELFKILSIWISLSATDTIPQEVAIHLINYHETMPSAFTGRSEEMHKQFGWQMLRHVVVGPEPIQHPYFQAFLEGFMLPCLEGKMTLGRVAQAYKGGPAALVSSVYTCNISGYSSLRITFTKTMKEETRAKLSQAMLANPLYQSMRTVEDILRDFLEGRGIPCPQLLSAVSSRFNKGVNLEDAISDGPSGDTFRCRMFCWAATGVPFVLLDEPKIEVRLVDETDESYSRESVGHRISFLEQGLLENRYEDEEDPEAEKKDSRVAMHHWLLSNQLDNVEPTISCNFM